MRPPTIRTLGRDRRLGLPGTEQEAGIGDAIRLRAELG